MPRLEQQLRRNQERVAGKSRKALVGRITIAGGPERQHLPDALTRLLEQVDESQRRRAKVADAPGAGQRGRMKEDSAGAGKAHGSSPLGAICSAQAEVNHAIIARQWGRQRNRAGLPLPGFLDCSGYLVASLALSSANRASMSRSAWTFSASRTAAL